MQPTQLMLSMENRQSNQEVNLKWESKLFVASITGIRSWVFFSNSLKLRILSNKNEASLRDFILDPKTKYQE